MDPTFGNGKVPLPYMYAVSSDFSCNEGRVVDDEEGVVGAADLGDGTAFVDYNRLRYLLVPELNDGCTSGRGCFSNRENIATTTMVRIDDHVYATDDSCGGGWRGHGGEGLGFRCQHAAFGPIGPLGVVDHDSGRGVWNAGGFRYRFGNAFNYRRLLVVGASFEHVNVDYGHVLIALLSGSIRR